MIHHWKGLNLEITAGEYQFDWTISAETKQSQTLNVKHVEIMKVSDEPTYDTSFEMS